MRKEPNSRFQGRRVAPALLFLSALPLAAAAWGQDNALVTDRPDFTESAEALDPGYVQLETGYTYEEAEDVEIQSLGELLVRIGWTERLELRLGLNSYVTVDTPAGQVSGPQDSSIGIKIDLVEGSAEPRLLAPQAALIVGTSLPTGDDSLGASHLQPGLTLAVAWPLTERLGVGSNLGLTWVSDDGEQYLEGAASLALGASLTDALGSYIEYYAFLPESSARSDDQFVNAGVTYLISDDFQIDLRVGTQVGAGPTDYFVGAGLAYRW